MVVTLREVLVVVTIFVLPPLGVYLVKVQQRNRCMSSKTLNSIQKRHT